MFFDALIVVGVCALFIAALFDLPYLGVVLLFALAACLIRQVARDKGLSRQKPNLLDVSILVVALVEMLVYLTSTYRENSFHALFEGLLLYSFYYLIRFHLTRDFQYTGLYVFLSLTALALSAWVFYNFIGQYQAFKALGISDLSNFRQLIYLGSPPGVATGEWMTRFVLLLPFPLLLFLKFEKSALCGPFMWGVTVATCLAALLSFSRGMYVAVFMLLAITSALMLRYRTDSLKKILLVNLLVLTPVVIALVPLRESALTTVAMFKTSSQVRSYEGRTGLWRQSLATVKAFPLFGVGSYNFPLHDISYRNEADERSHVGKVFNLFLQVLIEKGTIGLIAYGLLFCAFFKVTLSRLSAQANPLDKKFLIVLVAACAAVTVRDLSYSSLLINQGAAILLWFVFADSSRRSAGPSPPAKGPLAPAWLYHAFAMAMVAGFALAVWEHRSVGKAESLFRDFAARMKDEQYADASACIEEATRRRPDNAQFHADQALLGVRMLQEKFHISALLTPKAALGPDGLDEINRAVSSLQRALELSPNDDAYHHNLGWLFWGLGQPDSASRCFQKAVEIDPTNEMYHVSLGLFYESLNQKEAALNQYLTALVLSPGLVDSRFFMELRDRLPTEAERLVDEAALRLEDQLRQSNSPVARAKLGKLYLYRRVPEQSLNMLTQAATELPGLPRAWFNLGLLFEARGDDAQTVRCFDMATVMNSRDAAPWIHLGDHYYGAYERNTWKTDFTAPLLDDALTDYERGLENWLDMSSAHADRVPTLYRSASRPNDDVIPNGFLHYLGPYVDVAALSLKLSELHKQRGNQELAKHFEEVSRRGLY